MKVSIGKILGANGLNGAVKVKSYTKNPQSLAKYSPLKSNDGKIFEIEKLLGTKNDELRILFTGIKDRNSAEVLKGVELSIEREALPALKAGEFYFEDIVGFEVFDEKAQNYGKVLGLANFGAGDLLEFGMSDKKSIMVLVDAISQVQNEEKKVFIDSKYVVL